MQIETKAYGPIEIDEKQKIVFPEGLLGFEGLTDYALIGAEQEPFLYLQSIAEKDAAFVVIDPFLFRPDYEADIDNKELEAINITSPDQVIIFAIVTIPRNGSSVTANLQGPLVINKDTRAGKQAILSDPRWKIKHDIMEELRANAAKASRPC